MSVDRRRREAIRKQREVHASVVKMYDDAIAELEKAQEDQKLVLKGRG